MINVDKQAGPGRAASRESPGERFQRIYKEMRQRICLLSYPPGTRLNEGKLAQDFHVSRTPVRNVLQRLNYEGLVETRNGIGTIVTHLDLKAFKDIYELRMQIAEAMGSLSPVMPSPDVVQSLRQLYSRVSILKQRAPDSTEYARCSHELHDLLLNYTSNQSLREIKDLLYYKAARIWLTFLPNLHWREEVAIQGNEIADILRATDVKDIRGVGNTRRQYLYLTLARVSRYMVNV